MKPVNILGVVLTILGILMFFWGLIAGFMYTQIKDVNAVILTYSLLPLLLGPWLWLGETPGALKKFVEAKIEKSALEKAGKGGT
jgi:drug/metabolite transporter (DMT)-like permease